MVLQPDGAAVGNFVQVNAVDDELAIDPDGHELTPNDDFRGVPFPDGMVRIHERHSSPADFRRLVRIHTVAIDFAGPVRPVPDVVLGLAVAARKDTRIGIGHGHHHGPAVLVPLVGAVGKDDRYAGIRVRLYGGKAPVDLERVVAVILLAPEALVSFRLAFRVIVDNAVDHLPVAAVAFGDDPAVEVFPVEYGSVAFRGLHLSMGRPGRSA